MKIYSPTITGSAANTNVITVSQTSSLSALSASFAATSSYANNFTVGGTLTAQTINVQTITSSIDYVTGSAKFGSLLTNTHQFTGSVSMTGSLSLIGGELKAGRVDTTNEGGQLSFGRSTDNATGWYIDVYGNTSTPDLRFVDVSNSAVRLVLTSAGLLQYKAITDNGLVGSDASGNLNRVNPTYTEIATGTITYSGTFGYGWGINNSFPGNIRNYTRDLIAGTSSATYNNNYGRGVTFDLGSAKAVRKIVEIGYSTKNLDSINVQYSSDNTNWTTIFIYNHIVGNEDKTMEFNHTGAISARYWRWFIDGWVQREETNYYTYENIIYT
jgi:hypothetical protein